MTLYYAGVSKGDKAAKRRVLGLVHHAHAAHTQLLKDSVVRDGLADECVGVRHSTVMLCCKLRLVNESGTALVAKLPVRRTRQALLDSR